MKKTVILIAAFLFGLFFSACDMGNGGNQTPSFFEISSRNKTGIKSLYVSNVAVNTSARAATSAAEVETLSYINSEGKNTPFLFVSPSGKTALFDGPKIDQPDNKRILLTTRFYYDVTVNKDIYTIGELQETLKYHNKVLVDFKSNKVYDFTEYGIGDNLDSDNLGFINNDLLFTNYLENGKNHTGTIYKIDLANMPAAEPLNNNEVLRLRIVVPFLFGNKLLAGGGGGLHSIDINKDFQPKKVVLPHLIDSITYFPGAGVSYYSNGILLTDLSDNPYFYSYDGSIGRLSIDDDGNMSLSDENTTESFNQNSKIIYFNSNGNVVPSERNAQSIMFLSSDGIVHLEKEVSGLQVEKITLSIPSVDYIFNNYYIYYLEGSSIMRLHLSTGSSPETVYTDNSMITTAGSVFEVIGNNVFFRKYADDNISVHTYSLPVDKKAASPQLVSTSRVEIKNIVELDF